jgi:hypothetical protein
MLMLATVKQPLHARTRKRKQPQHRIHEGSKQCSRRSYLLLHNPPSLHQPRNDAARHRLNTQHSTLYTLHTTISPVDRKSQMTTTNPKLRPQSSQTHTTRSQHANQRYAPAHWTQYLPSSVRRTTHPVRRNSDRRHEPHCVTQPQGPAAAYAQTNCPSAAEVWGKAQSRSNGGRRRG